VESRLIDWRIGEGDKNGFGGGRLSFFVVVVVYDHTNNKKFTVIQAGLWLFGWGGVISLRVTQIWSVN
jgi:hypothetical protein